MADLIPAPVWTGRSDPEDGPNARRIHHIAGAVDAPVALIGFACEAGVIRNKGRAGAAQGPDAIRAALANMAAPAGGVGFTDLGNVAVTGEDPGPGQSLLGAQIAQALAAHDRVVVLGGGHETAFGSWQGLRAARPDARIGIINLDAHLDIRQIGPAGPSSGTPFAQIRAADAQGFDYLVLGLAPEGNTQALLDRAAAWGVGIVPDSALQTGPEAAHDAIAQICARNDAIYLSIDLDVLPGGAMPGVSAPAARGVPLHVIEALMAQIARMAPALPLIDLVELSPPNDPSGLSARVAALLARKAMFLP